MNLAQGINLNGEREQHDHIVESGPEKITQADLIAGQVSEEK